MPATKPRPVSWRLVETGRHAKQHRAFLWIQEHDERHRDTSRQGEFEFDLEYEFDFDFDFDCVFDFEFDLFSISIWIFDFDFDFDFGFESSCLDVSLCLLSCPCIL